MKVYRPWALVIGNLLRGLKRGIVVQIVGPASVKHYLECTAPDGNAGVTFVLVQATLTDNYHQGQPYSAGKGEADGGGCVSTTTGRVGETIIFPF